MFWWFGCVWRCRQVNWWNCSARLWSCQRNHGYLYPGRESSTNPFPHFLVPLLPYCLLRPPHNTLSRRFLKSPGWAKRRNHRSRDLCAWECACVLVCVGGRALRGKFWLCRQTMFSCIAVKVSNNFWVRFFHNSTVRASLFLHPSHFSLWICT